MKNSRAKKKKAPASQKSSAACDSSELGVVMMLHAHVCGGVTVDCVTMLLPMHHTITHARTRRPH